MAGERLEQVKAIFTAAVALQGREREVLLAAACRDDDELRREVESLLRIHDAGDAVRIADSTASIASTEATPLTEKPGMRIGPYKLLQQIGEGGFGGVFMADQEHPIRRRVALKIIKLGMDTRRVVARFEAERQALAMMDHPNIARVLDAGATESGRPYFVMELVKGDPITDYCDRNNLSIPERLELFTQVCNAVQHAHTKGVIHRDIKPSNVLVSTQDGRPHAKVIDFGIAKATDHHLTDKTLFTEHKALIGTPAYMSPEQAEGSLDIDTRTDIYALGVLLYELLTGTTPFDTKQLREAAFAEIHRIIRELEPPKPSTRLSQSAARLPTLAARRRTEPKKLGILVRGELDWIVMKALDKDRARRYETANSLAADVQRHLTGEPVVAAPPSAAYRAQKFVHKHQAQVIAAMIVLGALLLALGGTSYGVRWAIRERDKAEESERLAKQNEARALEEAQRNAELGEVAQIGLGEVFRTLYSDNFRPATVESIDSNGRREVETRLKGKIAVMGTTGPGDVDVNSDGSVVIRPTPISPADSVRALVEAAKDAATSLIDQRNLAEKRAREAEAAKLEARQAAERAEFGEYVANIAAADASIKADEWQGARARLADCKPELRNWEWGLLNRRATACKYSLSTREKFLGFSPDGTRLLTTSQDNTTRLRNIDTGELTTRLTPHANLVVSAAFSPDGMHLLTISQDNTTQVWDAATGEPISQPMQHADYISSAVFTSDGTRVLTTSQDITHAFTSSQGITTRVWDAASGQPLGQPMQYGAGVQFAVFSPDGTRVLTSSKDNTTQMWDATTGDPVAQPIQHAGDVCAVAFGADGARVLTSSQDRTTARVWDAATGDLIGQPMSHAHSLLLCVFSADGKRVLTSSYNTVRVWDATTGRPIGQPIELPDFILPKFGANDARVLIVEGETIRVWDSATGNWLAQIRQRDDDEIIGAHISPDGKYLVTGCSEYRPAGDCSSTSTPLRVWDMDALSQAGVSPSLEIAVQPPEEDLIDTTGDTIAYQGRDGSSLSATEGVDSGLALTLARTTARAQFEKELRMRPALSPDGHLFVAPTGCHSSLPIYDVATGRVRFTCRGHEGGIVAGAFSPDGRHIVTASKDNTSRIFDASTGNQLAIFKGHLDEVIIIAFSPDGLTLATGSKDGTVRLWDIESQSLIQELKDDSGDVISLDFGSKGNVLATGTSRGTISIWSVEYGSLLRRILLDDGPIDTLIFSSDDSLWTISGAGTVRQFPPLQSAILHLIPMLFDRTGAWDTICENNMAAARLFRDMLESPYHKGGRLTFQWKYDYGNASHLAINPDSSRIAVATEEQTIRIMTTQWGSAAGACHADASTPQLTKTRLNELLVLRELNGPIDFLQFTPDGRRLVALAGGTVQVWDAGPPDRWYATDLSDD